MKIAVAIPCYKVTNHVMGVIAAIGPEVDVIYAVDDACPQHSGKFIEEHNTDPRVRVLYNPENRGVGGAIVTAYKAAIADGMDIVVKIDGDGQMNPVLLPQFVRPLLRRFQGLGTTLGLRTVQVRTGQQIPSAIGREEYVRVRLEEPADGGLPLALPVYGKSGLLGPLIRAHGLLRVDRDGMRLDSLPL